VLAMFLKGCLKNKVPEFDGRKIIEKTAVEIIRDSQK
jgi:hypothetical protein